MKFTVQIIEVVKYECTVEATSADAAQTEALKAHLNDGDRESTCTGVIDRSIYTLPDTN